jgi:hypothetical protein
MSVSPISSISGPTSVTDANTQLQRAQQRLASDLATKVAAAKVVTQDRDAVARAQEANQEAQAAAAAQRMATQQVLPPAQTPQQQSKPITASSSALGGSFDVTV